MQFEIESRSVTKKKFLSAILPSIAAQLKMNRSTAKILIFFRNDIDHCGLTVGIKGYNLYTIALNSKLNLEQLGSTLAHEMVHVNQMAKGKLVQQKNGSIWCGKFFKESTPYLERPWEIQAYQKQELLFRKCLN